MNKPIISLSGSIDDELNFDFRRIFPENCGLAAVINVENASEAVYKALALQVHRGEAGAGIISHDGYKFIPRRRVGDVRYEFNNYDFRKLPGDMATGQVRYPTAGDEKSVINVPPFLFSKTKHGAFTLSHNGTLVETEHIEDRLLKGGAVFQSTTDSEILGHLISQSSADNIEDAIIDAMNQVNTAYSIIIMTEDKVYAARDREGVRLLSLARLNGGYMIASENYVFDMFEDCDFIMDIEPGQMVVFERGNSQFRTIQYAEPDEHFCIFEAIYFSNPRTHYRDVLFEDFRRKCGSQLYLENQDIEADCVIPIMDGGKHGTKGFCKASGIEYEELLQRIQNPVESQNRSFTSIDQSSRISAVNNKRHLKRNSVYSLKIYSGDDSIVRSNTSRITNELFLENGAVFVGNLIFSPPIRGGCLKGMAFAEPGQLIAYNRSIDEIQEKIKSSDLRYLSLEGLHNVVKETFNVGICDRCFTGKGY